MATDENNAEPELTNMELRQLREVLRASNSTKAVLAFTVLVSKWVIAVAGAVAVMRYLIIDYFGVGKH